MIEEEHKAIKEALLVLINSGKGKWTHVTGSTCSFIP
jgi:hypothetical protein